MSSIVQGNRKTGSIPDLSAIPSMPSIPDFSLADPKDFKTAVDRLRQDLEALRASRRRAEPYPVP